MRDRLIELIQDSVNGCARHWAEIIADYLLKNGVVCMPCKVGDYVEWDNGISTTLKKVKGFYYDPFNLGLRFILDDFAPVVNHSSIKRIIPKEEAEKHLQEVVK